MYRKSSFLYTLAVICKEIGIFDTRLLPAQCGHSANIQKKTTNSNIGGFFRNKLLGEDRIS